MKKTYMSRAKHLRLVVDKNGERESISFGWDIVSTGGALGSSYTTEDEAMQKAIEAHKLFDGVTVWYATPEAEPTEADDTLADVKTIADARQLLREKYGKTVEETKTKVQVLTLLNELGLHYPLNN